MHHMGRFESVSSGDPLSFRQNIDIFMSSDIHCMCIETVLMCRGVYDDCCVCGTYVVLG